VIDEFYTCKFDKFAMPVKAAFAATVGSYMDEYGVCEPYESQKDAVISEFGVSYRQWQINFSESYMKPMYGKDIFGKLFTLRNGIAHPYIVVSDSGFIEEFDKVVAYYGKENVLLARIIRKGCDFTGDSRTYIDPAEGHVLLNNDGTKEQFATKVVDLAERFFNNNNWRA